MSPPNIRLIMSLIGSSHCKLLKNIDTGTCQGSVMSTLLYCGAINPVFKKLRSFGYFVIAFADDFVLCVPRGKSLEAIANAKRIFKEYTVDLNDEKCTETALTGEIEFLG